jgi:Nitrate and nitrite sensing
MPSDLRSTPTREVSRLDPGQLNPIKRLGYVQHGQELTDQRQTTDAKRGHFASAAQPALLAQLQPAAVKALEDANAGLANLAKLREAVSSQGVSADGSSRAYSEMVDRLLAVSFVVVRDADQNQVKSTALALSFLQRAGERAGRTRAIGSAGIAGGGFSSEQLYQLSNMQAEETEFIKLFAVFAPVEIEAVRGGGNLG